MIPDNLVKKIDKLSYMRMLRSIPYFPKFDFIDNKDHFMLGTKVRKYHKETDTWYDIPVTERYYYDHKTKDEIDHKMLIDKLFQEAYKCLLLYSITQSIIDSQNSDGIPLIFKSPIQVSEEVRIMNNL